jgi:hypothetical protein
MGGIRSATSKKRSPALLPRLRFRTGNGNFAILTLEMVDDRGIDYSSDRDYANKSNAAAFKSEAAHAPSRG